MFVILVYDVKASRDAKVRKIVKGYLRPVQESVFDGNITQKNLNQMKNSLSKCVDVEHDYIRIYKFSLLSFAEKEEIGKFGTSYNNTI